MAAIAGSARRTVRLGPIDEARDTDGRNKSPEDRIAEYASRPAARRAGSYGNDDALDGLDELEAGGAEVLRSALTKANNGYIEAPDGSIAFAPADIIAVSQGNPPRDLPENVAD